MEAQIGNAMTAVRFLLTSLLLMSLTTDAFAQASEQNKLSPSDQRVKQHVETILKEEPNKESKYRSTIQQARQDMQGRSYQANNGSAQGAIRHPWYFFNPTSEIDFKLDSAIMWTELLPQTFWPCFQLRLLAKGSWHHIGEDPPIAAPLSEPLKAECMKRCPDLVPLPPGPNNNQAEPDNRWEVTEFWRPEYVAYVNDYGINRLRPEEQSSKGAGYMPTALRAAKGASEGMVKSQLRQKYPIEKSMEFPRPYKDSLQVGHEHWGGTPSVNQYEANQSAHVARTRIAYRTANAKLEIPAGWAVNKISMFDGLGPRTPARGDALMIPKDILSIWTEYGLADALVRIPDMTRQLGAFESRGMSALFGGAQPYSVAARNPKPFWQSQGAMAFRVGRWPEYQPLQKVLEVQGSGGEPLRELVWKGGHELFPLVMNLQGFETPALSTGMFLARRAFYIAGEKSLLRYHPDGELGRILTYTVNTGDPGTEVDKMQLIWPRRGGGSLGFGLPSQCFRSQKIPNMVDQTQDGWVKTNFPHDLIDYVKETKGDVTVAYWNKRVVCSCKFEGIITGTSEMNFPIDPLVRPQPDGAPDNGRGSGDRHYGRIEQELCEYPPLQYSSAWASQDKPACPLGFKIPLGPGLNDRI